MWGFGGMKGGTVGGTGVVTEDGMGEGMGPE